MYPLRGAGELLWEVEGGGIGAMIKKPLKCLTTLKRLNPLEYINW